MASAMKRPISESPLAETVATCAISSFEVTAFEFFLRSPTTASTAVSTPRFRSIGFMPAATALAPSLTMAWASTVAVVVPSPAWSELLDATSQVAPGPTPDVARVGMASRSAPAHLNPPSARRGAQADAAQGAVYRLDTGERHRHSAY